MPHNNQHKNKNNKQNKKKNNKGPAHQNTFAFRHNPKSKLTAKILNSPILHVCRKCHEKLEWRKTYRKYKPRTQPGTCNLCRKRNVLAAYHTICTDCTTSPAALEKVEKAQQEQGEEHYSSQTEEANGGNDVEAVGRSSSWSAAVASVPAEEEEEQQHCLVDSTSKMLRVCDSSFSHHRACAVCVKEPALPSSQDDVPRKNGNDDDDGDDSHEHVRVRLRERKTMERKLQREQEEAERVMEANRTSSTKQEELLPDDELLSEEEAAIAEPDDPFLEIVGGADKLLTGEAYRENLLQQSLNHSKLENESESLELDTKIANY